MKKIICLLLSFIFILTPITSFAIFEDVDSVPTWSNSIETFAQIQNKVELQLDS